MDDALLSNPLHGFAQRSAALLGYAQQGKARIIPTIPRIPTHCAARQPAARLCRARLCVAKQSAARQCKARSLKDAGE